jgi:hypothetical protein
LRRARKIVQYKKLADKEVALYLTISSSNHDNANLWIGGVPPHLSHFPPTNPIRPSGSAAFDHLMPLKKNSYIKETALLLFSSHYIKLQSLLFTLALHISVAGLGGERMERGEL